MSVEKRFVAQHRPSRPFVRDPFESLPRLPRVPHPYFDADTTCVEVRSRSYGQTSVHTVTYGNPANPPLLLVHGLMTTSFTWRYLLEPLSERFYLVAPDLPGCGRSSVAPGHSQRLVDLSGFLGDFQTAFGIQDCLAVGNSLGGSICLDRQLSEHRSFTKLAVLHAPLWPLARVHALTVAMRVPGSKDILRRLIGAEPAKWAHRNVHYADERLKSLQEAHEYGDPLAERDGLDAFSHYLADAMRPSDIRGLLKRVREGASSRSPAVGADLLLFYVDRDPVVPPWVGDRVRAMAPAARFHRMVDSSHFPHVDKPVETARVLSEFFSSTA